MYIHIYTHVHTSLPSSGSRLPVQVFLDVGGGGDSEEAGSFPKSNLILKRPWASIIYVHEYICMYVYRETDPLRTGKLYTLTKKDPASASSCR